MMSMNVEELSDADIKPTWGYRHRQCLILFVIITLSYSIKSCMGVALVAMTHHDIKVANNLNKSVKFNEGEHLNSTADAVISLENASYVDVDAEDFKVKGFFNALLLSPPYPSFRWNKKVQDTILSSFHWGYMILQIPAGQLAHKFGTRNLLTGAMLANCVVSAFLPLAAFHGGWIGAVLFRFLQGLSQACIFPSIHTFLGKWAPMEERGRLSSLIYGGQALGKVLGLPITGFISASPMGWPGLFRFFALLSGLIAGTVWWFGADTPAVHPKISTAERKYIENGLGHKLGYDKIQLPVPWAKIFKSAGVYAIIASHIGCAFGQIILYSEIPVLMDQVMGVNIKAIGLLTALPFVVMWCTNFFFSWFTDMLIVKKVMSISNVRKLANSIGSIPPAIGLIALAYLPKNIYVVETLLVIICGFKISAHMGYQVNHIDISPNFAGTLMSLSNFAANAAASLAPIVAGIILTDVKDESLWRQVFFVTAGFYFFTNMLYVIFGTAERAEWNDSDCGSTDKSENPEGKPMLLRNKRKD